MITLGDEVTAKIVLHIARNQESIISSASVCDSLEGEETIQSSNVMETIEGLLEMEGSPFRKRSQIRDLVSFSFYDPNFKRYILIRNAGLQA